jgi:phosphatidylglycerol:prolipoprotein diacylglycerol transferase
VTIGFEPIVVQVGPWALRAFGVLALVGLGVAIWYTLRLAQRDGLEREPILRALAWAIPVGVLSGRAAYLLGWWDYYLAHMGELARLSPDGLSLWGGLMGGGLVAAATLRHAPLKRRRIFDVAAPALALGIVIGRLGQFLDGYGQGLPSTLPWATDYSSRLMATPDFGVPRHPAQVYDALVALGLFVLLRPMPSHWRAATFLVVYSAASLALAQTRVEPTFLFGLQIDQMLAALTLVGGLAFSSRLIRRPITLRRPEKVAA